MNLLPGNVVVVADECLQRGNWLSQRDLLRARLG